MQVIHKLNDLLDRRQKGKIGLLIGMMTVGTLFETISLSMLIPVVTLFISPTALADYGWLLSIFSFLGIHNVSENIPSVIMVLIGLYLIKGVYQVLQEFKINTFIVSACRQRYNYSYHYDRCKSNVCSFVGFAADVFGNHNGGRTFLCSASNGCRGCLDGDRNHWTGFAAQ